MPQRTRRQALALRNLNGRDTTPSADDSDEGENDVPEEQHNVAQPRKSRKKPSLRDQLTEREAHIHQLESSLSTLSADFAQLQIDFATLSDQNRVLIDQKNDLTHANRALKSLKRKTDTYARNELVRRKKRIKRLENDRGVSNDQHSLDMDGMQDAIEEGESRIRELERDLAVATTELSCRDKHILSLQSTIREKQSSLTSTRQRVYMFQKQAQRAKLSLAAVRKSYKALKTWHPMKHGQYTSKARQLARKLTWTGTAAEKLAYAVESCAEAFGIGLSRNFMSARTVERANDEGGKYGELQLGREIAEAPGKYLIGFIESSDSTTHRGMTVECRHITLPTPSYAPGVDDNDQSTWSYETRFVEVAQALDHTAQSQFEGTKEVANRLADLYNRSPLSEQERRTIDKNDYWRKKMGECRDHASDGKKAFELSAAHKKNIIVEDLGRAAIEDDADTSGILLAMLNMTDDDLMDVGQISEPELRALPLMDSRSDEARNALETQALERKLGEERFNKLTPEQQKDASTHVFGGCCSHKDMNVVKYGYRAIQAVYATNDIPAPVLLANKANTAIIELGSDSDSAAVQKAVDSSTSGAIKLLQLLGSLLRHKDRERGYQERAAIYLHERKLELYGVDETGEFPDVSNNRYNCYTKGAREVVCFHGIIVELITDIVDSKTQSGQENHVEKNILKGLNCAATMTELVALALYGTSERPINMLSLTPLHRKLPEFCAQVAADPRILLDATATHDQLTITGRPIHDTLLLESVKQLLPDLPHFDIIVSAMFSGCNTGWIHFTPEFKIGGTFDCLTPAQRASLFIPTTNDPNEGGLGTYRNYMKVHCNSTAQSFSNETRVQRNNTEAFIVKVCDEAVEKFVMREVRKDGTRGVRAKFKRAWYEKQREKAAAGRKRRAKTAARKKAAAVRLAAIKLELDMKKIEKMTSEALKDQLSVYKNVLNDEELVKKRWKDMTTVAVRRQLVLDARLRELARW
ncbi:hypothetical protein FB45DRAFT_758179 [Roridomyces roridus]|uniref:Uncharacterized protein n=1 Tax=Roridomyces roridus TaxID=1738132 RepID=A0AAD7BA84_9AGAR|nr:hypothetical protein FB45DRAFT_758179 [Roridomyces roridus]